MEDGQQTITSIYWVHVELFLLSCMEIFSRSEGGKRMPNPFFSETCRFEIFAKTSLSIVQTAA